MTASPAILLASGSPRRGELLAQIGVTFSQFHVDVDETRWTGESADAYVRRVALDKARAGWAARGGGAAPPVLGADTAVVVDNRTMGKPRDRADGIAMLQALSGRNHQVLSAVALVHEREALRVSSSIVTFRTLGRAECEAYWDSGEPADKAGGYAIQGLAAVFVTRLQGSYSGVMGLPLFETAQLLKEFGINII